MRYDDNENYEEIRNHPFLIDIDFTALECKHLKVPGFDLLSQTTDSDEQSSRKDSSVTLKKG